MRTRATYDVVEGRMKDFWRVRYMVGLALKAFGVVKGRMIPPKDL